MAIENNTRLDKALVLRGLAPSRTKAQVLIAEGKVSVNEKSVVEPDTIIRADDTIVLVADPLPWVSRGALKLEHALDHWHIDPRGKVALDIGASTGGFTDMLLSRGAAKVYALDVGHDQLAEKLRNDPRVVNMEGTHINDIVRGDFNEPIDLIVIDVSFISLTKILAKVEAVLSQSGVVIALVKPQFEVGRGDVGKGVVKDTALHERVLLEVDTFARSLGFTVSEPITSPIFGGDGNKEFLILLGRADGVL